MRSMFQFVSMFAAGVLTLGLIAVLLPWVQGHAFPAAQGAGATLHFDYAVLGLSLGLAFGILARDHWADIPRRMVTWVLVRERQFFYYALIAACLAVLVFY